MNDFISDTTKLVYHAESSKPVSTTSDLYYNYSANGWTRLREGQSKQGSLLVWPGAAAFVVHDKNQSKRTSLVSDLDVVYPSEEHGGRLVEKPAVFLDRDVNTGAPPIALVPTGTGGDGDVYWNSWVENEAGAQVDSLGEGEQAAVIFDLANVPYASTLGATASKVGKSLLDLLEQAHKRHLENLQLSVLPILVGDALEFTPDQAGIRTISINLKILEAATATPISSSLRAVSDVKSALHDTRTEPRKGCLIRMTARKRGCGAVALSVWNGERNKPIDFFVQRVAVGIDPNKCVSKRGSVPVDAQRLMLLGTDPGTSISAAVHVFELRVQNDSEPQDVAVYVQDGGRTEFDWILPGSLKEYLPKLTEAVARSHQQLESNGYDPATLSRLLEEHLFSAATPNVSSTTSNPASQALAALRGLVSRPSHGSIFARLVDEQGRNLFVPIGLLTEDPAAPSSNPIAAKIDISEPLFSERVHEDACIGSWTLVVPCSRGFLPAVDYDGDIVACDELNKVSAANCPSSTKPKPAWMHRLCELRQLERYLLKQGDTNTVSGPGEGFILLAHHADGEVWFNPADTNRPDSGIIHHNYGAGSVAIMAACSVGLVTSAKDRAWLEKLSDHGIRAAIVSPFDVPDLAAARFVVLFSQRMSQATQSDLAPTLGELFRETAEDFSTDKTLRASWGIDGAKLVYEFQLVGDPQIALCRPEKRK